MAWRGLNTISGMLGKRVGPTDWLLPRLSVLQGSGPSPTGPLTPSSPKLSVPTLTGPVAHPLPNPGSWTQGLGLSPALTSSSGHLA